MRIKYLPGASSHPRLRTVTYVDLVARPSHRAHTVSGPCLLLHGKDGLPSWSIIWLKTVTVYSWTFLQCARIGELYDWWRGTGERKEALIKREIRKGRSEKEDWDRGRQPHTQRCWTQWLLEGGTGWHRPSFMVTCRELRAAKVCERSETHSFIAGMKQSML